jgi:hypothetical protein
VPLARNAFANISEETYKFSCIDGFSFLNRMRINGEGLLGSDYYQFIESARLLFKGIRMAGATWGTFSLKAKLIENATFSRSFLPY